MTSRSKKSAVSKSALRNSAVKKSAAKTNTKTKSAKAAPAKAKSVSKTGKLPEWNLADLYSGIDAPEVARDLEKMDADCVAFETDYKGCLLYTSPSPRDGLLSRMPSSA